MTITKMMTKMTMREMLMVPLWRLMSTLQRQHVSIARPNIIKYMYSSTPTVCKVYPEDGVHYTKPHIPVGFRSEFLEFQEIPFTYIFPYNI